MNTATTYSARDTAANPTEEKMREINRDTTGAERKVFQFLAFFFQVLTITVCYGGLLTILAVIETAIGSPVFGLFLMMLGICLFYYNADVVVNYSAKVSVFLTHGIYKGYKWVKSLFA